MKKIASVLIGLAMMVGTVVVATPASAAKASYSKEENRLWKGVRDLYPLQAQEIGKKTTVKIADSSCRIFDNIGTDSGLTLIYGIIADGAVDLDGVARDLYIDYMVGTVIAGTYTICKEHRSDLDSSIDNI